MESEVIKAQIVEQSMASAGKGTLRVLSKALRAVPGALGNSSPRVQLLKMDG